MRDKVIHVVTNQKTKLRLKLEKENLWNWVISNVPSHFKNFSNKDSELIFLAIHFGESPLCPYGNKKYFYSLKKGYAITCPFKGCRCHLEWLNSPTYKNKVILSSEKRKLTTQQRWGVNNPSKSLEIQEKKKKTNQLKYGVDWAPQSSEIKIKIQKTNFDKYGVSSFLKTEDAKKCLQKYRKSNLKYILDKMVQTNLIKYGVKYSSQSKEVKDKIQRNNLSKYGFPWITQTQDFKDKSIRTLQKKYGVDNFAKSTDFLLIKSLKENNSFSEETKSILIDNKNFQYYIDLFGVPYLAKRMNVAHSTLYKRIKKNGLRLSNRNRYELELEEWLTENSIEFIRHDRNIISPKEIDFYIPSLLLGIEFQGTYWHMDPTLYEAVDYNLTTRKYAYQQWKEDIAKINLCKEKNVTLFCIWEKDWNSNKEFIQKQFLEIVHLLKNN